MISQCPPTRSEGSNAARPTAAATATPTRTACPVDSRHRRWRDSAASGGVSRRATARARAQPNHADHTATTTSTPTRYGTKVAGDSGASWASTATSTTARPAVAPTRCSRAPPTAAKIVAAPRASECPAHSTASAAPDSTAAPRIPMVANAGRHVVGSVGTAVNTNPSATAEPHSARPSAADTASIAPRPTASQAAIPHLLRPTGRSSSVARQPRVAAAGSGIRTVRWRGGVQHRGHNALISGASTDVAGQRLPDGVRGQRLLGVGVPEQLQGRDKESWCAEPALKAAALGECPPQPGRLLELIESLDGVDPQSRRPERPTSGRPALSVHR